MRPDTTASRTHLCGFDLNLTYPQNGHFPTLNLVRPTANSALSESLLNPTETRSRTMRERVSEKFAAVHGPTALDLTKRAELHGRREEGREQWKRDLSGRANGTIDPFYGCFLLDELIDYAVNFTFPWCEDPSPPVFFMFELCLLFVAAAFPDSFAFSFSLPFPSFFTSSSLRL